MSQNSFLPSLANYIFLSTKLTYISKIGFGVAPGYASGAGYPHGLLVDPCTGKRIVNELAGRKERSEALLKIDHPGILLCDSKSINHTMFGLKHALEHKVIMKFETLWELVSEITDI